MSGARATIDGATSEAAFQRTITDLADVLHLPWYHDADARRNNAGFPDLVIPTGDVLRLWELKTMRGRLRPAQRMWRDALMRCQYVQYAELRPCDWWYVVRMLKGAE